MPRLTAFFPFTLLIPLLIAAPGLQAQESQALQLPEQGDVRIIVDISGSMKTNDPNNLRQPAVRLLARMIPDGADAGVWTFGQWVNMLVPHGEVDDAWRSTAVEKSREINSVALRTNLGEAIEKASDAYLSGQDLSTTDFILLTDGKVDLSDDEGVNRAERERIMGPLLKGLTDRGATLHTVALSDEADLDMLEALAAQSGGHFSLSESAEGLNRAFLKALNAAVPQDQIPLSDEGFTVDSGVEEFTALIFWGEEETSATRSLELVDPNGQPFTKDRVAGNMRWAAETGYDLITVTEPAAGQWQVNGELGEGSRVTVVSDLRMVVSSVPPTFTADAPVPLKIAFFEEDSRIENADFLNVIEVVVRLTSSDGRSGSKVLSGDQPPSDGIYTDEIASLPAAGDYELEVIADGTTFSRRFSATTRFVAPETAQPAADASPEVQAEPEEPAEQPEQPAEPAPMEPIEQADSDTSGPIDLSEVETPAAPIDETPVSDQAADASVPLWVWAAAGGAGLLVVGGGIWFLLARRKRSGDDESADEDAPIAEEALIEEDEPAEEPEPAPAPESEPESEETADEEIPELDANDDEPEEAAPAEEPESAETEQDDEIPELEPEADSPPEPEAEPEPETDAEQAPETTAEPEPEEDDDEFGLEDFDLSEFDDLPEDTDAADDKKKKDE